MNTTDRIKINLEVIVGDKKMLMKLERSFLELPAAIAFIEKQIRSFIERR